MEVGVFPQPEVISLLKKFVTVQLFTDFVPIDSITPDQREQLARKNVERLLEWANENTNPNYVVLSPAGEVVAVKGGLIEPPFFVEFLNQALRKLPPAKEMKVARSGESARPAVESQYGSSNASED
jgi:thiol:disulfide interchange protein DsbD